MGLDTDFSDAGRIYQINVRTRQESGVGLPKISVEKAILGISGFVGDFNHFRDSRFRKGMVSRTDHFARAVSLYTEDMIDQLNREGYAVQPGDLGENLDLRGISYAELSKGNNFSLGEEAVIELTSLITPCKNLCSLPYFADMDVSDVVELLQDRRGWYARVLTPGWVEQGDEIRRVA